MQLGLARAVAAHAVDVHTRLDHLRGEDGRVGLVGGHRGDDVGAAHRFGGGAGADDLQVGEIRQVADQFFSGLRIDVVDGDFLYAQVVVESQRLEFALRAVADQRHASGIRTRQGTGSHQRSSAGAQRGGHGEFGEQHRITRLDIGQHAEGHHGEQPALGVLRVAVDVLEGIAGDAGGFVEGLPAHEILSDGVGEFADEAGDTDLLDQLGHRGDVDEAGHGGTSDCCDWRLQIGLQPASAVSRTAGTTRLQRPWNRSARQRGARRFSHSSW